MEDAITKAIRAIVREEVHQRMLVELPRAVAKAIAEEEAAQPVVRAVWQAGNNIFEPSWTTKQVAEFLGLKPRTIHNRVSASIDGFPRPRKHGKLNAFIPSEVAAYRARILGLDHSVTSGQDRAT